MTAQSYSPLSDQDLCVLIDTELTNSLGGTSDSSGANDSELMESWRLAFEYYFGKSRGDEVEGRSKVISMDLADMIEQTVAALMPAFETDNLVSFGQYGNQDAKQAAQESDAVNFAVLCMNNGFIELENAIKNSLLQRNGILKVWIEERVEIIEEDYENVGASMLLPILESPDIDIIEHETVNEGAFTEEGFMLIEPIFNVTIRKRLRIKQLRAGCVPGEEFTVNQDHNSIFLDDARFVCHTRNITRSELISMGIDPKIVKLLPAKTTKTSIDQRARSRGEGENDSHAAQKQSDRIEVKECYYRVDMDGDGFAERRKILKAGSHILDNEVFPHVPFCAGSPFMLPNRFWGLSMFDKLKQVQDTKTSFLRKTLDNAEGLINQRVIAVNGQVNMDDLLSTRPTGVVRAKRADSVTPFPVQALGDTGFKMMNYMDKVRKEGGGAQLDLGTQENIPVQGQTAHGMERWMSSMEQLPGLMVKNYAKTLITGLFRLAHTMIREYLPERLLYLSQGQVTQTVPGTWPQRAKIKINVQDTMAERQRKYIVLQGIIDAQKDAMANGKRGVLTSDIHLHNALTDQARLAGFDNPERYWIDPTSPEAQQAMEQNRIAQEQAQAAEIAQQDKLLQTQLRIQDMSDKSDQFEKILDHSVDVNEQARKWYELELEHNKDIKGQGVDNGRAVE